MSFPFVWTSNLELNYSHHLGSIVLLLPVIKPQLWIIPTFVPRIARLLSLWICVFWVFIATWKILQWFVNQFPILSLVVRPNFCLCLQKFFLISFSRSQRKWVILVELPFTTFFFPNSLTASPYYKHMDFQASIPPCSSF